MRPGNKVAKKRPPKSETFAWPGRLNFADRKNKNLQTEKKEKKYILLNEMRTMRRKEKTKMKTTLNLMIRHASIRDWSSESSQAARFFFRVLQPAYALHKTVNMSYRVLTRERTVRRAAVLFVCVCVFLCVRARNGFMEPSSMQRRPSFHDRIDMLTRRSVTWWKLSLEKRVRNYL